MSCRRGAVETRSRTGRPAPPLLLTKLVSPLFISWPVSLTVKSSSDWPVFPLQPPPYVYAYAYTYAYAYAYAYEGLIIGDYLNRLRGPF